MSKTSRRLKLRNRTVIMRTGTVPRARILDIGDLLELQNQRVPLPAIGPQIHHAPLPAIGPHNHRADHHNGAVMYIERLTANNMTAYFAHDVVHYTGVQLEGRDGTDACFGAVSFLQHDAAPAGMNAYKNAFERAQREKVQYAFIKNNEVKFKIPKPDPAYVQAIRNDLKKKMENIQELIAGVEKAYVEHAMAQLEAEPE